MPYATRKASRPSAPGVGFSADGVSSVRKNSTVTSFQQSVSTQLAMMKACAHILRSRACRTASRRSPRKRYSVIWSRSAGLTPYVMNGTVEASLVLSGDAATS